MPRLTITQQINATPDVVFDVFADIPHAEERISGITNIEMLTDGPVGPGTRWRESRMMFKKEASEEMEFDVFEPGQRYTVVCDSCGCHYETEIRFVPDAGGTKVEMNIESTAVTTFAKIMSPFSTLMMGPVMKKCMRKDMEELRAHIEGEAAAVTA